MDSPVPEEPLLFDFGSRLAELRASENLTQEALAQRLDVTAKYAQRLERGLENVTLRTVAKIANVLNISPLALFIAPLSDLRRKVGRPRKVAVVAPQESPFRRSSPRLGVRSVVPLITLVATADSPEAVSPVDVSEWLDLGARGEALAPGHFAVRVRGASLAPTVPEGSVALFRAPVLEPHNKLVLVELGGGEKRPRYVLKRASVEMRDGGNGPNLLVKLASPEPGSSVAPLVLHDGSDLRIAAEWVGFSDPAAETHPLV